MLAVTLVEGDFAGQGRARGAASTGGAVLRRGSDPPDGRRHRPTRVG